MFTLPPAEMATLFTEGLTCTAARKRMSSSVKPSTEIWPTCCTSSDADVVVPSCFRLPATLTPFPKMVNPPENETSLAPAASSSFTWSVVFSNWTPPNSKAPMLTCASSFIAGAIWRVAPTSTVAPSTWPSNAIEKPGGMAGERGESWHPLGARMNSKKLAEATPPPTWSTGWAPLGLPTAKSTHGCAADSSAPTLMGMPWPGTCKGPATLDGSCPSAISFRPGVSVTTFTSRVNDAWLITRPSTPKASFQPAGSVKVSDADTVWLVRSKPRRMSSCGAATSWPLASIPCTPRVVVPPTATVMPVALFCRSKKTDVD